MASSEKTWRVLVTSPIPEVALRKLRSTPGLTIETYDGPIPMPHDEIIQRLKNGVDALYVTLIDRIDRAILTANKDLRVVSSMSVGFNHVDVAACKELGVPLGNTPGVLTETVADTVLLVTLATCRRAAEATRAVRNGEWGVWRAEWMCGLDVHGATVGIVGLGRIGLAVAKRLKAFDCRILYTDIVQPASAQELGCEFVSLDHILEHSDIVIPLCPLTDGTRHMFNAQLFRKMKKTAVLINCSRGEVVQQDDLYQALKEKTIYAAGLDVTYPEPLPTDDKLLELDNCFVLPHIASASTATRNAMAELAADNLINVFHGKPMKTAVV